MTDTTKTIIKFSKSESLFFGLFNNPRITFGALYVVLLLSFITFIRAILLFF